MSSLRRAALRTAPESIRSLWRLLGQIFGDKRPRLIVHPILGMVMALSETISLLAIIRLLLMLVDGTTQASLSVGPVDVSLSFGQLAGIACVTVVTTLLARLLEARVATRNQAYALEQARRLVIDAWFEADWEQLHAARLGRLQQLLGLNAQQAVVPVQLVSLGSVAVLSLGIYLTIVIVSAPTIALLFAAVAGGSAALLNPLRRRSKRLARQHAELLGDLQLSSTSYAQLNRELHVFGVQHAAAQRLNEMSAATAEGFARLKALQRVLPSVYQQVLLASIVGIVIVGRVIDVNAVRFGTAAILAVRSLTYIQQLNTSYQLFVEARPYLDELFSSVTANRLLRRPRGDTALGPVAKIALVDVSYRYPSGTEALSGIDLELASGDWLGVIGPSGGGKTTLANVIAGLLVPSDGAVQVNDQPVEVFSAGSWASQFGLLSQEPVLLAATVSENIAFHREASPEEVRAAAALAGIEREIDALPEGFDSLVGEGRSSLSGGQRQRLALARCLLGSPSCLILDEPTSALDAANEALVERSLLGIPADSIVIVVSHRRALLHRCNRFVVLEGGRVVAQGGEEDVDLAGRIGAAAPRALMGPRRAGRVDPMLAIVGRAAAAIELLAWRFHVRQMRRRYEVDPSFKFHLGSRIYGDGRIILGPGSYVNNYTYLRAAPGHTIRVGRGCRIGPNVRVYTQTVDPDADLSVEPVPRKSGDVEIRDWAWIGAGVYIGPGITIGENSVVGANSVVTRDVEPFEIVAGAPLQHRRFKKSRPG